MIAGFYVLRYLFGDVLCYIFCVGLQVEIKINFALRKSKHYMEG